MPVFCSSATRYLVYQVVLGNAGDMGDTRIGILRSLSPLSVHRAIVALNLSPHSTSAALLDRTHTKNAKIILYSTSMMELFF